MNPEPRTTIAIVNYNTREHLRACLASISCTEAAEVIVVDNASSDGSADMVRAEFPWVTLAAKSTNPGYGAGANAALQQATTPYVLLLNSDTRLAPGALTALTAYMDQQPQVSIAGPRLTNPDGTLQISCYHFPTPLHVFLEESGLGKLLRFVPGLRSAYLRTWSHDRPRDVPWVMGAALMIRRDAFLSAGGFDTSFFMYFEEVDLARRLRDLGWETHYAPVASIAHVGGASTRQQRAAMMKRLWLSGEQYYRRHHSAADLRHLHWVLSSVMLARWLRETLRLRVVSDGSERVQLTEAREMWGDILAHTLRRQLVSS